MANPSQNKAQLTLSLNAEDNVSKTADKVEKRISKYSSALKKVRAATSAATEKIGQSFAEFSVAAVNSIIMLQDQLVNPLKGMIAGFSEIGFSLEKMARNARLSTEALGALGFAAEQMGGSTENVVSAMQTMEDKFKDAGRGSMAAMMEIRGAIGRTYESMKDLSPEERFLKIADIIRNTAKEADKADIARKIFGSDDLLPLLNQGSDAIRKLMQTGRDLGAPVSGESVQKSKELAQAFSRIKTIFEGMKTDFLTGLTDSILENLEILREFMMNAKTFIQENPELVKNIALVTGGIVAVTTAGIALIPVIMGLSTAISTAKILLMTFLNPWFLIPGLILGGLAACVHFTGGLEDLRNSVTSFFSSMLESVGASSSSLSEIVLAAWFKVQEGFIKIWMGMKSLFTEVMSYFSSRINSFRKDFQGYVNWAYGKMTGLSDEEIREMTVITNTQFDAKAKEIERDRDAALLQNAEVEDQAIEDLRRSIQGKIKKARKESEEAKQIRIQMKEQRLQDARQNLTFDANDPSNPAYVSGGGGDDPANWLREMVKDSSKGTQNSFQAIFGYGQTTEEKQLDVTRQIFQILQAFQAQGVIQ
ncbi:MAG: hypothetical protein IJF17_00815 [Thermoguttaceae bacterium]|nr:hypothetical protein [Thermoguttaceae bacterium]